MASNTQLRTMFTKKPIKAINHDAGYTTSSHERSVHSLVSPFVKDKKYKEVANMLFQMAHNLLFRENNPVVNDKCILSYSEFVMLNSLASFTATKNKNFNIFVSEIIYRRVYGVYKRVIDVQNPKKIHHFKPREVENYSKIILDIMSILNDHLVPFTGANMIVRNMPIRYDFEDIDDDYITSEDIEETFSFFGKVHHVIQLNATDALIWFDEHIDALKTKTVCNKMTIGNNEITCQFIESKYECVKSKFAWGTRTNYKTFELPPVM